MSLDESFWRMEDMRSPKRKIVREMMICGLQKMIEDNDRSSACGEAGSGKHITPQELINGC